MPEGKPVKITAAKGRPMLTWVGKRPLSHVTAFPAQHIETFDPAGKVTGSPGPSTEAWPSWWPSAYPQGGLLFHGDNKEVLAHLLANGFRGKVRLIYIDPPFDSGADYTRKVSLRGPKGAAKIDGEAYCLGEQIQYTDIWTNDNYLQFMYERLLLLKELLTEDGSIALHCDAKRNHYLRMLLEEVFGDDNFRAEIEVVCRNIDGSTYCGECKWSRQPVDLRELAELEEKAKTLPQSWREGLRYVLFSRSGFKPELKDREAGKRVILVDLEELYATKPKSKPRRR